MSEDKRVILVKGDQSKWYDQAIFIVGPNSNIPIPLDLVKEAEEIIRTHIQSKKNTYTKNNNISKKIEPVRQQNIKKYKNVRKKNDYKFLNTMINFSLISCMLLIGIVMYSILK